MSLLLFLISLLFATIFYSFYDMWFSKKIFWESIFSYMKMESISWNLLFEIFMFLFLWILFFLYFSPNLKLNILFEKHKNYLNYYHIWFFLVFFILIFSGKVFYDTFILFWMMFFMFSDLSFNILSNLEIFKLQKNNLSYFWLFLNFCSSFISIYYLLNMKFSFLLLIVLIFNMLFNYYFYKKYQNMICQFSFYTIIIFLLAFFIFRVYYLLNFNF